MFKRLLFISAACLSLNGCIAGVAAAGAVAAGGTVMYDHRSVSTMYTDRKIDHLAYGKVAETPDLAKQTHLNFASINRVLLMVGQAPSAQLREQAYKAMASIPDVRHVYNQVTIAGPTSAMTRSSDTWITTKVKAELLTVKGLHSSQIKVLTEDGVVYMMGVVDKQWVHAATESARRVSGVRKVVELFEQPANR